MACLRLGATSLAQGRLSKSVSQLPVLSRQPRCTKLVVRAQKNESFDAILEAGKGLALSCVAAEWMMAGQASAATELAQVAASDGRLGAIGVLFLPVIGWVLFNMLQPLQSQLGRMDEARLRGIAGVVGMGSILTLAAAGSADAATEISQLAAGDGRLNVLLLIFAPVVGWVLFNMLQPLQNQLSRMSDLKGAPVTKAKAKRGIAGAIGLGGALTLLAAENADAATDLAQLADSDGRVGAILTLFVPAVGWVLFNILQPLLNQLGRMDETRVSAAPKPTKKSKK